jgi:transcription initiation factor TFIIB
MESLWSMYDQMKEELEDDTSSSGEGGAAAADAARGDTCYSCGEREFLVEDGCMICQNCGRVNGNEIDYNQEWRYYGNDDNKGRNDPTRCGIPINPLLPDSSLGTIILGNGQQMCRRLHRWNSSNPKERSLIHAYNEINEKTAGANIPVCIVDKAKVVYKTLSSEKIKRGTTRKGLMAACIYYTLKDKQISRSTQEISTIFSLKQKKMTTGCKYFNEIMYSKNRDYLNQIQPTTTKDFIERFSLKLGISNDFQTLAIHICQLADKLGIITESTPPSIAVGCLYLMIQHFGFNITKKHLSGICEISEVTISKSYKKLLEFKDYLIPEDAIPADVISASIQSPVISPAISPVSSSNSTPISSDVSTADSAEVEHINILNTTSKSKVGRKKKNLIMVPETVISSIEYTNLSSNSLITKKTKKKIVDIPIQQEETLSVNSNITIDCDEKKKRKVRMKKQKDI